MLPSIVTKLGLRQPNPIWNVAHTRLFTTAVARVTKYLNTLQEPPPLYRPTIKSQGHSNSNSKHDTNTGSRFLLLIVTINFALQVEDRVSNFVGGKYDLLKRARDEWEMEIRREEQRKAMEYPWRQSCTSSNDEEVKASGGGNGGDIASMTRWVWILHRAGELERKKKSES